MTLIALTGGIASGKSTIGRALEQLGAVRIDADELARAVVEPGTPALEKIRDRFGASVIGSDGALDRAALGAQVFGKPEELRDLNAIVHPAVADLSRRLFDEAAERDSEAIIVYEIPLLAETRRDDGWDAVVVADAPAAVRIERLMTHRDLSREDAVRRVESQASDEERRAIADIVIDTSGTLKETREQVDRLWRQLAGEVTPERTPRTSSTGIERSPR